MTSIAIKTGTGKNDGSNCRAVMEICDSQGSCCKTTSDGSGLHPGQNREIGQIDVYTNKTILGNCSDEVIHILVLIRRWCKSIHFICR